MQSFRTELEDPLVEKDIIELERKIRLFKEGEIHEDKFRSLRLARGVYGQRQPGVQMVRIKLPLGQMSFKQWKRIADISDAYSTGNLHLTTRQDIQIHYVSLDSTPQLWAELEKDKITLREACGNTVRNITASVTAGIDKNEPFDITPYATATFQYFLRNPICQEMGRKIKIAFSNNELDTALTFMHDLGFIPKIKDGKKGFKVLLGGGLGAQPRMADVASEFLEVDQIIPFVEKALRVFDRYGERNSRNKARLKFLIEKIGLEEFLDLVEQEGKSLPNVIFPILDQQSNLPSLTLRTEEEPDTEAFKTWLATNVIEQKQKDFFAVFIRVPLGNISSSTSRSLIQDLTGYVGEELRITINQGLLLRYVPKENLGYVYEVLKKYRLEKPGANSIANITACPGTDTCNLAISDSTSVTRVFEEVIDKEFPELILESNLSIKISGCMNSCGQHGMANIGFHGSSLRTKDRRVLPALQVLLGGGVYGDGKGRAAEKIIKVPSKRGPEVLRFVLSDYEENALEGEYFNEYFDRLGKMYFYELLKPLTNLDNLKSTDFVDWGRDEQFETAIGIGECAAILVDLIGTLFFEAEEKQENALVALQEGKFADSIYFSYSAMVHSMKALLLAREVNCNTQQKIILDADELLSREFGYSIAETILQINQNTPSEEFASKYLKDAKSLHIKAVQIRETETSLQNENS